jgi:hypothetical protein
LGAAGRAKKTRSFCIGGYDDLARSVSLAEPTLQFPGSILKTLVCVARSWGPLRRRRRSLCQAGANLPNKLLSGPITKQHNTSDHWLACRVTILGKRRVSWHSAHGPIQH